MVFGNSSAFQMRQDDVLVFLTSSVMPTQTREEWIIRQARERSAAELAAFLDGACAGDVASC